ncbi:DnaD and phage-associated domain-containing protein [Halobacillus alkaliphilus]|uniref:DnaD and phage-associated domain-containing protein n=1 Tax=Halobacillus alkaliphilus TaxID=396056 RepID=A0A1I2M9L3_9BACI|nr:DnaD domain protein [Halobacillus alkaliphilus]SFF85911.1 DnaD and phage-associated domain-containing protein [Halobacillus alkaliphilus]
MNYLRELNGFFDQIELDGLSASAVGLWYTMMQFANKSGWREEFSVPASALRLKSGLKETAFKRARKELVDKGYIEHRSVDRNHAPFYKMISRERKEGKESMSGGANQGASAEVNQKAQGTAHFGDHPDDLESAPLYKRKEKRENHVLVDDAAPLHFYEQNFQNLTPYTIESISRWCAVLSEDLVIESMKMALMQNKIFFKYCEGILKKWERLGVKSVEEVRKHEEDWRLKRKGTHELEKYGSSFLEEDSPMERI